jgi:hypothetical protein
MRYGNQLFKTKTYREANKANILTYFFTEKFEG